MFLFYYCISMQHMFFLGCFSFVLLQFLLHLRFNDTTLLSTLHLMDYSLLLAAKSPKSPSRSSGQLSMGIIDYLRAYTMDKKVESTIKSLGTSLTQSHPEQPTIIHPTEQLWKEDLVFFLFFTTRFSFGGICFLKTREWTRNVYKTCNQQSHPYFSISIISLDLRTLFTFPW